MNKYSIQLGWLYISLLLFSLYILFCLFTQLSKNNRRSFTFSIFGKILFTLKNNFPIHFELFSSSNGALTCPKTIVHSEKLLSTTCSSLEYNNFHFQRVNDLALERISRCCRSKTESVWRGRIFSGRSPGVYSGSGPTHPSFGCLLGSLAILHELSLFPGCLLSFFVGPRPGLRGSPLTWDHPVHPTGIPVCHVTCHTHTLNPS